MHIVYAEEAISAPTANNATNANPAVVEKKYYGTVKWFDKQSGFGFITPDIGDEEVFVHFSNIVPIEANGRRSLSQGQRVEYVMTMLKDEQHVVRVTPLP
ncbi:hypothetical protein AL038_17845 [Beggiatoa leptomitoformis]|uniref:CSD domain-containing protein n=2 Tax=Beggiatoa leptomitoformis TaxID=288004 RepID=A0A2N9YJC2_9GAMM|nr:hypothetical protein AL038_17845 [Beggiatoa leptomitoformis]AUI70549.2 hypothetical protein BLE401_06380 [Beggiatoa leptomitoformis]